MPPQAVSVGCSGRFLSEVRVCMTKDLKPRACSPQVERQSCTLDKIIVQPLR
jgi:ribonuclease T2